MSIGTLGFYVVYRDFGDISTISSPQDLRAHADELSPQLFLLSACDLLVAAILPVRFSGIPSSGS